MRIEMAKWARLPREQHLCQGGSVQTGDLSFQTVHYPEAPVRETLTMCLHYKNFEICHDVVYVK